MNALSVLGVLRHILTFGGGFLVTKGIADEGTVQEIVGATITIIGFLWSIFAPEKKS